MTRKLLHAVVLALWFFSELLLVLPAPTTQAAPSPLYLSADVDGDGLPNDIEQAGWCNALGCFTTDYIDPDSDDDGLTDGEEKLFEADPTNAASPGIYVLYEDSFKTKEYFPWQPYGHKLIARGDSFAPTRPDAIDVEKRLGTNLDAVVVRRGTTFWVGGPADSNLVIDKSISSLTTLPKVKDQYTGSWRVTVPANGTAGKYTLTLDGRSLDLLVIFEMASPAGELTQQAIDKFLYDDNPNISDDNIGLQVFTWRYPGDPQPGTTPPYVIPNGNDYEVKQGHAYDFFNQQYSRFLMEDYVIGAINGKSSQQAAAQALTALVDENTIFRNPNPKDSSWTVLHPAVNDIKQQCSNVSGLLTSFSRAAGIPARALMTDWHNSTFDHANEIWVNGSWRVYRGYKTFEMADPEGDFTPQGCSEPAWPACGYHQYFTRSEWGRRRYTQWRPGDTGHKSYFLFVAREDWSAQGLAYRWATWAPNEIKLKNGTFKTMNNPYWGKAEPEITGAPGPNPSGWPPPPPDPTPTPPPAPLTLAGSTDSATVGRSSLQLTSPIQVGRVLQEYGVDTNGNGRYDQLVLETEVTAAQAGPYALWAQLGAANYSPALQYTSGSLAEDYQELNLAAGTQVVKLRFSGLEIAKSGVSGPYVLNNVLVTDIVSPGPEDFVNSNLAELATEYTTAAYQANNFESLGATLTDVYNHTVVDNNGDGLADGVRITTNINIDQPGAYTVEGKLYDAKRQLVAQASWSGPGPAVELNFTSSAGSAGPFSLREVNLVNAQGQTIDASFANAYVIEQTPTLASASAASLEVMPQLRSSSITPTNVFNEVLVNGNLQVNAQVQVALAGSYKLEAWLADTAGNLVTWASGAPTTLSTGVQNLSVTFLGSNIRARGINGPYKVVALKVLKGDATYQVLDNVDVALTTQAYALNQFATSYHPGFEDYVENGAGQWLAQAPWAIDNDTHLYMGSSKAWYGANANSTLTLATPLNFLTQSSLALKFHTSYNLEGAADTGYVEASTDGVNWDILKTISGRSSWSKPIQVVDLSAYGKKPAVFLRFRLAAAGGASDDGWYIDDILISGIQDGDGDGVPDGDETGNPTHPCLKPDDWDSDNDGLPDGWEIDQNLDPCVATGDNGGSGDPDDDGLTNIDEYLNGTDPHDEDSDDDGLGDFFETHYGLDPNDPTGDNGANGDPDDDGLTNTQEQNQGTDPMNPDTDGDGIPDNKDDKQEFRIYLPSLLK